MKVLVTGGTGFVGHHLIEALHHRGHQITALVRSERRAAPLAKLGLRLVLGDLHDASALAAATKEQDIVFHVAGLIAARHEVDFDRANREGTVNLLAAVRDAAVGRFVLVSSLAAAGPSRPGQPLRGSEAPHPVTAYGRSKLAAEDAVRNTALDWTIVRPPIVYGPRDREVLKLFKVARLGIAPVFGSGQQELSAVYGPDLAEALVVVAETRQTIGQTYYPCHPDPFTSAELIGHIGRALGKRVRPLRLPAGLARPLLGVTAALAGLAGRATVLNPDKANEFFQPAWTADPDSLTRDTGWHAAHDLPAGLSDTATWYRNAGWL
ncbi:MAG TPA: NAD-dependent epimerase/dehydratase family protein [Gemmatimonadales bacterium]|nr:NAD-dependent epimerase/dehydratase family protein [Gemmatimonadales bacterium]